MQQQLGLWPCVCQPATLWLATRGCQPQGSPVPTHTGGQAGRHTLHQCRRGVRWAVSLLRRCEVTWVVWAPAEAVIEVAHDDLQGQGAPGTHGVSPARQSLWGLAVAAELTYVALQPHVLQQSDCWTERKPG